MTLPVWLVLAFPNPASAMPEGLRAALDPQQPVPVFEVPPGERKSIPAVPEDKQGAVRYAITRDTDIPLTEQLSWQALPDGRRVARARFLSPTAASVSVSFADAWLPPGGRIWMEAADGTDRHTRPLTEREARGGVLYTPIVRADELLLTVVLPAGGPLPRLHVTGIHVGVRPFAHLPPPPQGSCNIDVVCPESAGWEAEIDAVAVYGFSGSFFCTGFMLNNTAEDQTPYFATAEHCGLDSRNDNSLTVYWNYESENCGDLSGGRIRDYQTGSTWRMEYRDADWTLVELSSAPDPSFEVAFAGWDRTGTDTTSAVTIHHPGTDEKAISFENDPTTVTSDYSNSPSSSGTHIRVEDWDAGTTEGGSSGSPLFSPEHRVIGALTGGYAACSNNEADWYGRLYTAWTGDGSSDGRLSNWLDPSGTGDTTVDTLAPHLTGIFVTPLTDLSAEGPEGGPFSPTSSTYNLLNRNGARTAVTATVDVSWAQVSDSSVSLAADADTDITVSFTADAAALPAGRHTGTVTFTPDDGSDVSTRALNLIVGTPVSWYSWNLDTDPGWSTTGDWAWGVPEGRGGDSGGPDPSSGATGDHVYGYNLAGDYPDRERARYLTTPALDFSEASGTRLTFQRWLGVEEPEYDNASIQITNDGGTNWTTIWSNEGEVADRSWRSMELDVAEWADGQARVQVRWVMGSTDESVTYCGWNIDDIEFLAIGTPPDVEEPVDTGEPPVEDTAEPGDTAPPEDTSPPEDTDPNPPAEDTATALPEGVENDPGKATSCGCSAASTESAGWLVVGLGLLGLVRRRPGG